MKKATCQTIIVMKITIIPLHEKGTLSLKSHDVCMQKIYINSIFTVILCDNCWSHSAYWFRCGMVNEHIQTHEYKKKQTFISSNSSPVCSALRIPSTWCTVKYEYIRFLFRFSFILDCFHLILFSVCIWHLSTLNLWCTSLPSLRDISTKCF